jgi:hypothetical protein
VSFAFIVVTMTTVSDAEREFYGDEYIEDDLLESDDEIESDGDDGEDWKIEYQKRVDSGYYEEARDHFLFAAGKIELGAVKSDTGVHYLAIWMAMEMKNERAFHYYVNKSPHKAEYAAYIKGATQRAKWLPCLPFVVEDATDSQIKEIVDFYANDEEFKKLEIK